MYVACNKLDAIKSIGLHRSKKTSESSQLSACVCVCERSLFYSHFFFYIFICTQTGKLNASKVQPNNNHIKYVVQHSVFPACGDVRTHTDIHRHEHTSIHSACATDKIVIWCELSWSNSSACLGTGKTNLFFLDGAFQNKKKRK